mmetsp:Transcript_18407/g.25929  ORF Transcript_18407/g.25929 Transcript_18407/m.25929 type:complete len:223 (-) Transcript_18407:260-928(-)
MPKSKRAKAVALTQTAKKTREHKASIIQDIRDAIDSHDKLYLFSYENMRSHYFKEVRMHFRGSSSRIFLGKNKVMQIALGTSPEDEYSDNLMQISKFISGSVGLLLTNESDESVEQYFSDLKERDFARAGSIASQEVVVDNDELRNFAVSMMEQFRSLGMPVEVSNGKVTLIGKDTYTVCKEGDVLSAEACKILTQLGVKLADFRVKLLYRYHTESGAVDEL